MDDAYNSALEDYFYEVPKELIAHTGAEPRESARLLTYRRDTGEITLTHFSELLSVLPAGAILVCNESKVIPARLPAIAEDGRTLSITITKYADGIIESLSSRRIPIGDTVRVGEVSMRVASRVGTLTSYNTSLSATEIREVMERYGEPPLPPYIDSTQLPVDARKERYQSTFAKHEGSVAAPTASLHFSQSLLQTLRDGGIGIEYVTLHVGLGTFQPLTKEHLITGNLHSEEYFIEDTVASRLERAHREGRVIVPVGTTALRTIESAFSESGTCVRPRGETSLFVRPGYQFKMARGLITNFHVPQSSLLMLVDAMLGTPEKWRELYTLAIGERFRFFSFGDGMLIL